MCIKAPSICGDRDEMPTALVKDWHALPPDRQAGRSCTAMMPDGIIIIDMHQSKIFPSLPRFTKRTFSLPPKTFDPMFLFLGRVR